MKSGQIFLAIAAIITFPLQACTGITIKTKDNTVISSRTLEFATPLDSKVIFLPRGFKNQAEFEGGHKGIAWEQKYAVLGLNALNLNLIIEGFNEKGLNVGAFYLPGFAQYEKLTNENQKKAMPATYFPTWAASNFATVAELKAALKDIVVVDSVGKDQPETFPLHFRVSDASGDQIVVEYVKDGLKIYDNPFGVITNSPEFDWHLINLRNYINLSATNVPSMEIAGKKLDDIGQGEGMHGLPGDFSPPSRLIRSLAIQVAALPVDTSEEGVNLSWHIINNTDIPIGVTRDTGPDGKPYLNHTQWTNVSDLKNLKLYFKTYQSQEVRFVDLNKYLNNKEVKVFPMDQKAQYREID